MNSKKFLAKNSINSMSAIHCKIIDNRAVIRISDCHNSIRLHNDITIKEERDEFLNKIKILRKELKKMEDVIFIMNRITKVEE